MADTALGVMWSLESPCRFRSGDNWMLPSQTAMQLDTIRSYASARREHRVLDGICIIGLTQGEAPPGRSDLVISFGPDADFHMPGVLLSSRGFRVYETLDPYGGPDAIDQECRDCAANVSFGQRPDVAGCHGDLLLDPWSRDLDVELRRRANALGLDDELRHVFPETNPLWFSFWINSPLSERQYRLLRALLGEPGLPDDGWSDDLRHFLSALDAAIAHQLPLHVEMLVPGHTDMGWDTTLAHCPRCTAEADVPRWEGEPPNEPYHCAVCGNTFVPRNTASSTYEPTVESSDECSVGFEELLGKEGCVKLIRRYLATQGHSADVIDEIMDVCDHGPLKRRIAELRRRQRETYGRICDKRRDDLASASQAEPVLSLELSPTVRMTLRFIPPGQFWMGAALSDPDPHPAEIPGHEVAIQRPFYLGELPVTQRQWLALMESNPSFFHRDPELPVEQVSWFMAQEFCLRLSQRCERIIRLPTEAEWEYAARAGTATKYHWGDDPVRGLANCRFEEFGDLEARTRTTRPGSFPPNPWGLFDMLGNVEEWCEDENHYGYDGAPIVGTAWISRDDENPFRALRGGWHRAYVCGCSARDWCRADANEDREVLTADENDPVWMPGFFHGFRVVCEC